MKYHKLDVYLLLSLSKIGIIEHAFSMVSVGTHMVDPALTHQRINIAAVLRVRWERLPIIFQSKKFMIPFKPHTTAGANKLAHCIFNV